MEENTSKTAANAWSVYCKNVLSKPIKPQRIDQPNNPANSTTRPFPHTCVERQHYITSFGNPVFGENVISITKYTVSCIKAQGSKELSFYTIFIYVMKKCYLESMSGGISYMK